MVVRLEPNYDENTVKVYWDRLSPDPMAFVLITLDGRLVMTAIDMSNNGQVVVHTTFEVDHMICAELR